MKTEVKKAGLVIASSLCFILTGCKSSDYKKAVEQQNNGNYSEAIAVFSELGDYQDAPERLKECQNKLDYTEAKSLIEKADYKAAVELLSKIGDYKDSSTLMKECQNEQDYATAMDYMEKSDYKSAAELFSKLEGFKDSDSQKEICGKMIAATDSFNKAVESLKKKNEEMDSSIKKATELVNSSDKALDDELRPAVETAISNLKAKKIDVPVLPETESEIKKQTEKINKVDYSSETDSLNDACAALELSIKQYILVDNPSEEYVISCLQRVSGITGISAATEENDPNGHLGKAGGYTAAVYFSHQKVDQSSINGDTLIDKGTRAGGQIEVYSKVEDAEKRDSYLAGFDGGVFSNGSHRVIGTVVVRTSEELTATQEKELEESIIAELINVEASEG